LAAPSPFGFITSLEAVVTTPEQLRAAMASVGAGALYRDTAALVARTAPFVQQLKALEAEPEA
jgi:hypothetical protein